MKLLTYQSSRKGAWILKVVQAAVRSESSELRVVHSEKTALFSFKPSIEFGFEALRDTLLEPQLLQRPAIEHLALGLRAVGSGEDRPFILSVKQNDVKMMLKWDGCKLEEKQTEPNEEDPDGVTLTIKLLDEEWKAIQPDLEACPIPIFIDNQQFQAMAGPPPGDPDANFEPLCLGWVVSDQASQLPSLGVPNAFGQKAQLKWKIVDAPKAPEDGQKRIEQAAYLVKIRHYYSMKTRRWEQSKFAVRATPVYSSVSFVHDGVIVSRRKAPTEPCPVSYELYLSAKDLELDPSRLELLENLKVDQRVSQAQEYLIPQLKKLRKKVQGLTPLPFRDHAIIYGGIGILALTTIPVLFGKLLIGGAAAYYLHLSAQDKKAVWNNCERHLGELEIYLRGEITD